MTTGNNDRCSQRQERRSVISRLHLCWALHNSITWLIPTVRKEACQNYKRQLHLLFLPLAASVLQLYQASVTIRNWFLSLKQANAVLRPLKNWPGDSRWWLRTGYSCRVNSRYNTNLASNSNSRWSFRFTCKDIFKLDLLGTPLGSPAFSSRSVTFQTGSSRPAACTLALQQDHPQR